MSIKRLSFLAAVFLATLSANRSSDGQAGYYGPVDPYYGYGPYGYRASTAGEGYARGMADVIRSYGENNLANARAQRDWEDARRAYIENRVRATEAFYERRALYDQHLAAKHYEEREKANAWLEKIRLEDLNAQEFNVDTGQIHWPRLLADPQYQNVRAQLDLLFVKRAQYGELDAQDFARAESLIKQWRAHLTSQRDSIPDVLLRDGLRFLLRLNRELEHNYG
jgi:hypothetical protein